MVCLGCFNLERYILASQTNFSITDFNDIQYTYNHHSKQNHENQFHIILYHIRSKYTQIQSSASIHGQTHHNCVLFMRVLQCSGKRKLAAFQRLQPWDPMRPYSLGRRGFLRFCDMAPGLGAQTEEQVFLLKRWHDISRKTCKRDREVPWYVT